MKTLLKMAAASLVLAVLAGCAAVETPMDEDYELGDTSGSLLELQERWCGSGNVVAQGLLLMSVRAAVPGYPAEGLCTDLMPMLEEAAHAS